MSGLRRVFADPFAGSVVVAVVLAAAGWVTLGLVSAAVVDRAVVAEQVPYVISGGFGGLGLVAFGGGLVAIHRRRWTAAQQRAEIARVIDAAADLLATVRREPNA